MITDLAYKKIIQYYQRERDRVIYPTTWQANLVEEILLFLVYSYDRRLIRNTTLLLVVMGPIIYRRYVGLQLITIFENCYSILFFLSIIKQ